MKAFKPATGRGGMDVLLRRHPKYGLARDLLLERFQDCVLSDQVWLEIKLCKTPFDGLYGKLKVLMYFVLN